METQCSASLYFSEQSCLVLILLFSSMLRKIRFLNKNVSLEMIFIANAQFNFFSQGRVEMIKKGKSKTG